MLLIISQREPGKQDACGLLRLEVQHPSTWLVNVPANLDINPLRHRNHGANYGYSHRGMYTCGQHFPRAFSPVEHSQHNALLTWEKGEPPELPGEREKERELNRSDLISSL